MEVISENNCIHYNRGCKLLAPCCDKFVLCRICHDDENDHEINRHVIKQICCIG